MALNSFESNQGTQTALLTDNTGGTAGTLIPVMKIDTSAQGTAGAIWGGSITGVGTLPGIGVVTSLTNGSVNIPNGTLQALGTLGTVGSVANLGSVTNLGQVYNAGTLQAGTVTIANIAGLFPANAALSDVSANPTTSAVGAFGMNWDTTQWQRVRGGLGDGAGAGGMSNTLPMMYNGATHDRLRGDTTNGQWVNVKNTVNIPGGTINILAGGTLGILTNGTLSSSGTTTGIGTMTNLGSVTNLGQVYNAGTLQGGTINTGTFAMTAGTLSPLPTIANVTYGTHGTTGVTVFGTLAGGTGSGAGTEIFITSLSLSIPSTGGSQDVSIGWGSNAGTFQAGTGLLVRGNFPPGGGIQKQFYPPVNSGTQAQLMYVAAGAGTVDISVTYFITTSSL